MSLGFKGPTKDQKSKTHNKKELTTLKNKINKEREIKLWVRLLVSI
jgi:hypothetical protein